jgi:hypothetical protein
MEVITMHQTFNALADLIFYQMNKNREVDCAHENNVEMQNN